MIVSALVLSPAPVPVPASLPPGVCMVNHCARLETVEQVNAARRRGLGRVPTEWVFLLDVDDELPPDAGEVIEECVDAGQSIAYTDTRVIYPDGSEAIKRSHAHNVSAHAVSPMMVHRLALMRTEHALEALRMVPAGDLWLEHPLYWLLARRGAAYVPRVGYHWRPGRGVAAVPGVLAAQIRAAAWCVNELAGRRRPAEKEGAGA